MSMKDTQKCIKTSQNALILLRIRPRINHFPSLITSKGFCKQCIHTNELRAIFSEPGSNNSKPY